MGQSLHQAYAHIVFSTKDRRNQIHGEIESPLHAYLGGIARDLDTTLLAANGMPDHLHLLIRVNKNIADADFMKHLKGSSSKWMNDQGINGFQWQQGYGWFSLGHKDLTSATNYLAKQKEHHQTQTFQDEFRKFLKQYAIDFDERYVWD
ncbi:MAG: IS200/IS605 family transposase [Verrucomicrobiaceae bacterium]